MFDRKKLFLDKLITIATLFIILIGIALTFLVIIVSIIRKINSEFLSEYSWLNPGFIFIVELISAVIMLNARKNVKTVKKYEKAFNRVNQQTSTYEISQLMQVTVSKVKSDIALMIRKGYLVDSYFMNQNNIFVINNGQVMVYNGNPNLVRQVVQMNQQINGFGPNNNINIQDNVKTKGMLTKIKDWLF